MSGDGKRGVGHRPQATAPILDSTIATQIDVGSHVGNLGISGRAADIAETTRVTGADARQRASYFPRDGTIILFAIDSPTACACSRNNCATGLSIRFLRYMTATRRV